MRLARKSSSQAAVLRFRRMEVFAWRLSDQVVRHVLDGGEVGGGVSFRTRHSSSRKTMSMTQCRLFSTAQ